MSLKSDLTAARALIDTPEKWHQFSSIPGGTYCAVSAVACATKAQSYGDAYSTNLALNRAADLPGVSIVTELIAFNDDPATTHADVLSLFDRAIAAAGDA